MVLIEKINKIMDPTSTDLAGWHVCLDAIRASLDETTLEPRDNEWKTWHEKYAQLIGNFAKS